MTKVNYQKRVHEIYDEQNTAGKRMELLDKQYKTEQEQCSHINLDDRGVFGADCLDCGKFWSGAF